MTRPCTVFEFKPNDIGGRSHDAYIKEEKGKGIFLKWGTELGNAPFNYTVAIVELPNGEVITTSPQMIRFDDVEIIA